MLKRAHVYYSGQVQGVGFRFTARRLAKALGAAGWARNLPDGRVELVAEAEEAVLKELLRSIKTDLNYYRFDESVDWQPAGGEFKDFEVRF